MQFLTAVHTDVGIRKKTNQDSVLVQQANTSLGTVLLAVLCDGMGGLAKGEVASASTISAFREWFRNDFPGILAAGMDPEALRLSWVDLVNDLNAKIAAYSSRYNASMGTTCVAILVVGDIYFLMNIGDSRAYWVSDNLYQLTKDQSFVQRELDSGRITFEESLVHPQRNVLLQCIGAIARVEPDFYTGSVKPGECYMLCSDGFRHVITPEELFEKLRPTVCTDQAKMKENLVYITELNKRRHETDNISAVLIRTF